MQVRKQQLELDMEQQTGSKFGKEYVKAVYCQPAYCPEAAVSSAPDLSPEGWCPGPFELKLDK